jgi:hypothetical protein
MSLTADHPPTTLRGWWSLDAAGLTEALRHKKKQVRRLQAQLGEIVAEIESRGPLAEFGYPTTAALVQDMLHVSRKEATTMVDQARALNPIHTGTVTVPPIAPLTATAAAEGAIGASQIDAITTALKALPANTTLEDYGSAEKILVDLARDTGPRAITRAGNEIRTRLDPDGDQPSERELAEPRRELQMHTHRDGWVLFKGTLDPESGAELKTLLSPLAAPHPSSETGMDPRDIGERQGGAFAELLTLASRSPDLPTETGERPHVVITLDYQTLVTGIGAASLDLAGKITASQARRLACDANIIPIVLGSRGEPMDAGRKHRLVTPAQRRALVLRDEGCAFPECERPAKHCHAHHIRHWSNGGATDLSNLVLLCGRHHRLIHHSGWTVNINHNQLPVFTPPLWLDPHRRPRHNRPLKT